VKSDFGAPSEIWSTDNGGEQWRFQYTTTMMKPETFIPLVGLSMGGANNYIKELVVDFDKEGTVTGFFLHNRKEDQKLAQ
jgi:hypothetical protein